jgi:hypothetical protein
MQPENISSALQEAVSGVNVITEFFLQGRSLDDARELAGRA